MYGETIAEELWTELNSGPVIVDFSNVQKKLATTESNKETDENLKIIEERDEVLKIIKDIAQSVGKGYYKKKDDKDNITVTFPEDAPERMTTQQSKLTLTEFTEMLEYGLVLSLKNPPKRRHMIYQTFTH